MKLTYNDLYFFGSELVATAEVHVDGKIESDYVHDEVSEEDKKELAPKIRKLLDALWWPDYQVKQQWLDIDSSLGPVTGGELRKKREMRKRDRERRIED